MIVCFRGDAVVVAAGDADERIKTGIDGADETEPDVAAAAGDSTACGERWIAWNWRRKPRCRCSMWMSVVAKGEAPAEIDVNWEVATNCPSSNWSTKSGSLRVDHLANVDWARNVADGGVAAPKNGGDWGPITGDYGPDGCDVYPFLRLFPWLESTKRQYALDKRQAQTFKRISIPKLV